VPAGMLIQSQYKYLNSNFLATHRLIRTICQIAIFSLLFIQHGYAFPVIGKEPVLFSDTLHLDGYYFPKAGIYIGSYELDWLALFAQGIKGYQAELRLRKQGKWIDVSSKKLIINNRRASFVFNDKRFGQVVINGILKDKNPLRLATMYADAIVFTGTITINGRKERIDLTYAEGD
jgi:hypothetical protein